MKHIYFVSIFLFIFLLSFTGSFEVNGAIITECDSINNELTSKFRFLGGWNAKGTPEYLEPTSDEVSQALINYVNVTLPESVNLPESNEDYFGNSIQFNTELNEASEVYLTMVHEGAGWTNALGYYTYEVNNPPETVYDIDSMVIIFPNVSQPNVINPGDKVLLGEFPANTGIGYFLIAKGWVGDTICIVSHIVFSDPNLNTFTSQEFRQQTILLNYVQEEQILLGFEDIKRPGGDNDFNDAVFYITAAPGAIDTTNIPKIPTALLNGDTTMCEENAPATLKVELTGQAPWTIIYNNGIEDIEISGIEDETFTFETLVKDTVTLVSVKDKNKFGIVDGEAIILVSQPKAVLSEDQAICGGGIDQSGFIIDLEGQAPFSLTYKVGNEVMTIENITENKLEVNGEIGKSIELIGMTDQFCEGEVIGAAVVRSIENPSLNVTGSGAICGDASSAILDLALEGEGPWIINYELDGEIFEVDINGNEYQLEIASTGLMQFTSIEDANCVNPLAVSYSIENKELPTAMIAGYENLCGDAAATVDITLTGEGPWEISYELNDELFSVESNETTINLPFEQSGLFELISVKDANCENIAEGSAEIEIHDIPTAFISGDATICNYEEEATVNIELTGIAPFTIVYTNGETETTVTTNELSYVFTAAEFTTYSLVSVDDAYCSGEVSGSATINDGSEDIQVEIQADETSCFGEDITLELLGETNNLEIEWTTEGLGQFANTDQISTTYTPADDETGVIIFYAEVKNNCAVKTVSKEVTIIEEIDANFDISPDNDLLTNTQITFTPTNSGYDEYDWNFGDGNSSGAVISSTEYSKGGEYTVELTIKHSGCEGKGSEDLEVFSKDELYVPNAFNPNAINSENQVVKVYGNNVDEFDFSFKIVNRWGKVMYETNSFAEANTVGWDGVNNNNDIQQELNVFTYILKGRFIEGDSFERTGTVTQVK